MNAPTIDASSIALEKTTVTSEVKTTSATAVVPPEIESSQNIPIPKETNSKKPKPKHHKTIREVKLERKRDEERHKKEKMMKEQALLEQKLMYLVIGVGSFLLVMTIAFFISFR